MADTILIGRGRQFLEIPQETWKQHLAGVPQHSQERLAFMTPDHHRVRYFAVSELVNRQLPLEPDWIGERLDMPATRVKGIVEELERKLFFLVRDEHGAVAWAYPVTVEPTPHRLNFSTGERLYAA